MKNKIASLVLLLASLALTSCGVKKGATYKWNVVNKHYENFTDLGDYVIDVDEHTNFDFQRALKYSNDRYDAWSKLPGGGCSALGTKAKNGDVLIGRNLDLTISQFPCYVTHVKPVNGFKYNTINFTYDELFTNGDQYKDAPAYRKVISPYTQIHDAEECKLFLKVADGKEGCDPLWNVDEIKSLIIAENPSATFADFCKLAASTQVDEICERHGITK